MRVLLIHRSFPGQFRYLAAALAQAGHEVKFLTMSGAGEELLGVRRILYQPELSLGKSHHYVRSVENAVLCGQAVYREAKTLQRQNWQPEVIFGHSGWGAMLYMKDLFPTVPLLTYSEWFYRAKGSTHGFNPAVPVSDDNKAEIRTKNAAILLDLVAADAAITPTYWQQSQFPDEFHEKMSVLHDGVDTDYFQPCRTPGLKLPRLGLELTGVREIVTYVATGMEPMRGFPQFIEAVSLLQAQRPHCHVVVVGEDRSEYSNRPPTGTTYRQQAMAGFSYDLSRLHFTGRLSLSEYREVLRASAVHVYLTYPFILSWSMLEAMACGCLVLGSATEPVMEVIKDGENGLLTDFFAPAQLARQAAAVLAAPERWAQLRWQARQTVLTHYDLKKMLPRQLALLTELAEGAI